MSEPKFKEELEYNPYSEKIDRIIQLWYYKSGIIEFYRKTNFELYKIYCFTIIPKSRKIIQLTLEIKNINKNIQLINEEITKTTTKCKALEARLQPWEKVISTFSYLSSWNKPISRSKSSKSSSFNSQVKHENPETKNNQKSKGRKSNKKGSKKHNIKTNNWLYFVNKIFDWTLKSGLAFVIFLSLFEIITLLEQTGVEINLIASYFLCGFSAISLVWLSSATIYNAVLAESEQDNYYTYPDDNQSSHQNSNSSNTKKRVYGWIVYVWMLVIGGLEFFIGQGLISLIDKTLIKQNSTILSFNNNGLSEPQKWAITCSIAIFAIVNILYAYYRAKNDQKNKPLKHDIAFLLEKSIRLEQDKEELQRSNRKKEKKLVQLEKEIDLIKMYPHEYIHRRDMGLTNAMAAEIEFTKSFIPEIQDQKGYSGLNSPSQSQNYSQNGQLETEYLVPDENPN